MVIVCIHSSMTRLGREVVQHDCPIYLPSIKSSEHADFVDSFLDRSQSNIHPHIMKIEVD